MEKISQIPGQTWDNSFASCRERDILKLAHGKQSGECHENATTAYFVAGMASAPSVSELRRFLKEMLPEYMIPAAFVKQAKLVTVYLVE
jgi:hypothetical protein